jgi:hypothetical protein
MKKPLQRTEPRSMTRIAKTFGRQPPLSFVADEPNPIKGLDTRGLNNEQRRKKELDAVGQAFSKASKQITAQHKDVGYGVDYCVLVFRDAGQVTAFLQGVHYPDPQAHYVDGTILADILHVALPEPKVALSKLKRTHNPRLTQLAMPLGSKPR